MSQQSIQDKTIRGDNVVDRDKEQEVFGNLLALETDTRLLVIKEQTLAGKTALLLRLELNCKDRHKVPVGLIDLRDTSISTLFEFCQALHDKLKRGVPFDEYSRLRIARANKDFDEFARSRATFQGTVDLRGAHLSGSVPIDAAGNRIDKLENTGNIYFQRPAPEWTAEHEDIALDKLCDAFFQDLAAYAREHQVVVMLDHFEAKKATLWDDIYDRFLKPYCFDMETRAARLIVVLAGTDMLNFENLLGQRFAALVHMINSLREWERDHVRDILILNGYDDPEDFELDTICGLVERNVAIGQTFAALDTIRMIIPRGDRRGQ